MKSDDKEEILYTRTSKNRETGELTEFRIIAKKTGGRYWYPPDVAEGDRLILIRLIRNSLTLDFPLDEDEPSKVWEAMINVWVRDYKKKYYIDKILSLILKKKEEVEGA